MKINLAHISPNQNAYSETFIQNHRKNFDANVKFYYGESLPIFLEGFGKLWIHPLERLKDYFSKVVLKDNNIVSPHYKALKKSFEIENIQIVYAEYGPTGASVMDICKEMNIPLIVNFHGYDISRNSILNEYSELYIRLFENAYCIVAVSKVMEVKLVSLGCSPQKILYTPCPPDDLFFDLEPTYSEDSFLAVSRFVDKKAPYYTILALNEVLKVFPKARLYIAGNGELLNTCENLVRYLNLENSVTFLGICKHEELLQYYKRVKAFVQHSITALDGDMEGTPVAILEASAAALPVISTRHAGIPDVIINCETGFIVDEHDVESMAKYMIKILSEKDLSAKMGQSGRENVKNNFSMSIHTQKLNNIIQEALENERGKL